MDETFEKSDEAVVKSNETEKRNRDDIFSKVVRAGKRTYFFDVKATRKNDYYLTITESKKRFNEDGRYYFEKHKIFLYKEDFEKFSDNLNEVIDYIKNSNHEMFDVKEISKPTPENETKSKTKAKTSEKKVETEIQENSTAEFTNLEFEDLDSKE